MLNIYLVRHGETEWNIQKKLQGWNDSNLTENGVQGAKALHDRLMDMEFDAIYSSSSMRAFKTAEIIKGARQQDIVKDDNLREIGLGDWEGRTGAEIEKLYPKDYYNFWNAPHLYHRKDGETFTDVQNRALKTINKIIKHKKSGNILIVTHAVTLKLILAYFENCLLENLWNPPFVKNTSVSLIQIENNDPKIALYADTSHIASALG